MTSSLSLTVEGVHVIVRIDGEDVSRADNNAGPGFWHALVPRNRFVATDEFTTVPIACCPGCGPECFAVNAHVRREGDLVRWEWGPRREHTSLFDAAAYDAEVARLETERDWETPALRAGRLILRDLELPPGVEGVHVRGADTGELEITLEEPDEYQIFVHVPWDRNRPDERAAEIRALLAGPSADWPAQWHSIRPYRDEAPPYAGPTWRRFEI